MSEPIQPRYVGPQFKTVIAIFPAATALLWVAAQLAPALFTLTVEQQEVVTQAQTVFGWVLLLTAAAWIVSAFRIQKVHNDAQDELVAWARSRHH